MKAWQKALVEEWESRKSQVAAASRPAFPLTEQTFDSDEILAMTEVLLSGQLTMAHNVKKFESQFAEFVGAPHAVLVNSGSSANLLALAVATNPMREKRLHAGDEVIIPAVCWSTCVWPLIQMGLRPVFVDVDPITMNIDVADIKRKATARTKGLMAVHVLGNCAPMDEVMAFAKDRAWIVIEDTCESLGSKWKTRALGTLGDFGTYSFFFSHHMTTGEGGMVVCKSHEDADLLRCLRAHGWTRELSNKAAVEAKYAHIDPRFLFVNIGYNLRPMEIQAALGMRQLAKLPQMNQNRMQNWKNLLEALESHTKWRGQFIFPRAPEGAEAIWFGFPALLADSFQGSLRDYLEGLSKRGVENRPIVSGNFARQPGLALFNLQTDWQTLVGAEKIHRLGFFIGLHTQALDCEQIRDLANRMIE